MFRVLYQRFHIPAPQRKKFAPFLFQGGDDDYSVRICPGFVLRQTRLAREEQNGVLTLLSVEGVHFGPGHFQLATVEGSAYAVRIQVSSCGDKTWAALYCMYVPRLPLFHFFLCYSYILEQKKRDLFPPALVERSSKRRSGRPGRKSRNATNFLSDLAQVESWNEVIFL